MEVVVVVMAGAEVKIRFSVAQGLEWRCAATIWVGLFTYLLPKRGREKGSGAKEPNLFS